MGTERRLTDRREFLRTSGLGVAAAGALLGHDADADAQGASAMRQLTAEEKLSRIASSCWPPRFCFKSIGNRPPSEEAVAMKKKYGEITMLRFPQWTKDTYPGVYHLDLWSDVFGDPSDPAQDQEQKVTRDNGQTVSVFRWDPTQPASKTWLEKLAAKIGDTKTVCQHISNNAPQNLCGSGRREAEGGHPRLAKAWMDVGAMLGTKTMRANTGVSGTRIMPEAKPHDTGYPKNDQIVVDPAKCIESFRSLPTTARRWA